MTDALNLGCRNHFCEFCGYLGSKVAVGAGVQTLTLRYELRYHGNAPKQPFIVLYDGESGWSRRMKLGMRYQE